MDLNAAVQDTMEFLGRVRKLRNGIENKMRRIETLQDMATSTTAAVSDMPRSDSPNLQRMETVLCKVADYHTEKAIDRMVFMFESIRAFPSVTALGENEK